MATISNVSVVLTGRDAGAISTMQRLQQESQKTAQAVEAINKKLDEAASFGGSGGGGGGGLFGKVLPTIDLLGAGQTAIGLVTTAIEKLEAAMQRAENRSDLGDVLGFTYEQMQALNVAAALANTTVDDLSGAFGRFLKTVSNAASGSKEAEKDLKALGITLDDVAGKTAYEILGLVANRLADIASPADRARIAMELFGKESGIKMIQVLEGGSKSLEQYTQRARELGLVLNENEIAIIKAANAQSDLNKLRDQAFTEKQAAAMVNEIGMWKELWNNIIGVGKSLVDARNNATDYIGAFVAAEGFANNSEGGKIPGISAFDDALKGIRSRRGIGVNADVGPTVNALVESMTGPTLPDGILEIRKQAEKDLADFQVEQADRKNTEEWTMARDYFLWIAKQAEKQKQDQLKYARDVADYRRRLDEYDSEVAKRKQDALDQATREFDSAASASRPDLFISGTAEAQRMAFISRNAGRDENTRQEAIQERANQILQNIERNTSRGGTLTTIGL